MANIADFFVTVMQGFLVSSLVCKHFKTKYSYKVSLVFHMVGMQLQYFVMNYGIFQYEMRALVGFFSFCLMSFLIFEGTSKWKMLFGLAEYVFLLIMDMFNYLFIYPWMGLSFEEDMFISLRLLLARNTFNIIIYLVLVLAELWKNRRKGQLFVLTAALSSGLAICQLFVMKNLYQANAVRVTESAVIISIFYSAIAIFGYFTVMEIFEQIVKQQEKQSELEQMNLEKEYQYDYYKKALAQGERIRDLRHDMRNQLQTVECLLRSDSEEDRRRAEEMVEMLSEKAGGVC